MNAPRSSLAPRVIQQAASSWLEKYLEEASGLETVTYENLNLDPEFWSI